MRIHHWEGSGTPGGLVALMLHINFWFIVVISVYLLKCDYCNEKNTEALLVTSKESCLEVTAEKTKYTIMFRDEKAGQNRSIKTGNSSF